jgi:hypothetical protein
MATRKSSRRVPRSPKISKKKVKSPKRKSTPKRKIQHGGFFEAYEQFLEEEYNNAELSSMAEGISNAIENSEWRDDEEEVSDVEDEEEEVSDVEDEEEEEDEEVSDEEDEEDVEDEEVSDEEVSDEEDEEVSDVEDEEDEEEEIASERIAAAGKLFTNFYVKTKNDRNNNNNDDDNHKPRSGKKKKNSPKKKSGKKNKSGRKSPRKNSPKKKRQRGGATNMKVKISNKTFELVPNNHGGLSVRVPAKYAIRVQEKYEKAMSTNHHGGSCMGMCGGMT